MGDYDDLASTTEREVLMNGKLHDSTKWTLERLYEDHVNRFYKEISFMKGRVIGLVEGNHYSTFLNGMTTTQLLAHKMGTKYLGVSSFINLVLRADKHHGHNVQIWAHHGLGGGRTLGASINKLDQMFAMSTARICLMGHDHRKQLAIRNRFNLSNDRGRGTAKLNDEKTILARTGSFLKGYQSDMPSYTADACMAPLDLGVIKIELTPRKKKTKSSKGRWSNDERWVDIHASI